MSSVPVPITAIVLVGGRSRRMGSNKSRLEIGGRTLLSLLGSRLADWFGAVVVVGGDSPVSAAEVGVPPGAGFRWVPDEWPGQGPVGGLCSGLAAVDGPETFAVACDMPLLDRDVVLALRPPDGWSGDARVLRAGGRLHPLHAYYRVSCRPRLAQAFAAGVRSLHDALAGLEVTEVELAGPLAARAERSAMNVNTSEDLEAVRRWVAEPGCGEA